MGFIIKYNRFFSVTLNEESSGASIEGITFFPTKKCLHTLNNYNLVFRPRSYGFEVFYSETPLIKISEKIRLSFGFYISKTGFFKKYGLTNEDESDMTVYQPGLYFDNLKADGSVITANDAGISAGPTVAAADTYKMQRQTFKVFYTVGTSPPSILNYELVYKPDTSQKQEIPITIEADSDYTITTINSVDLKEDYFSKSGPYLLKTDTDPPPEMNVYLNEELGRKGAHGIVDIYWETSQETVPAPPAGGQKYNITFKPK